MAEAAEGVIAEENVQMREPKLTEKAIENKLNYYINGRRLKHRQLLPKIKATEELLDDEPPFAEIQARSKDFDQQTVVFKQLNLSVLKYLNKDEHSVDQECWFQPRLQKIMEFKKQIHLWLMQNENKPMDENYDKNVEHTQIQRMNTKSETKTETQNELVNQQSDLNAEKRKDILLMDKSTMAQETLQTLETVESCPSVVSGSFSSKSRRSLRSTSSSCRLREEAKRAALVAEAATLEQQRAIALKEAALAIEKKELQIQTALAISDAKHKVYKEYAYTEGDFDEQGSNASVVDLTDFEDNATSAIHPPATKQKSLPPQNTGARPKTYQSMTATQSINVNSEYTEYKRELVDIMK